MATVNITTENFAETIQDGIVFLDFWAEWCGPCRQFGPTFEKASEEHTDVTFGKINTEEQQELAAQFQIMSIPTIMVFRDGIKLYEQAGALPPAGLNELIDQAKKIDMDEVRKQIAEQSGE